MESRRITLGVVAAIVLLAPRSGEARARVKLAYVANEPTCPPEEALRSAVATRLGYAPFAPDADETIATTILRDRAALVAEVSRTGADGAVLGARTLRSQTGDCAELVASAAVTISIMLDPRSFMGPPPPAPAPDPHETPPPGAPVEPEAAATPPAAASPSAPIVPRFGATFLGFVGTAPAPSVGLEILAGLGRGPWSLSIGGRADLPASTMRDDGTGVRSSLLVAELAACRHFSLFGGCVLALGGELFGEGLGVGTPDRATSAFFALGPRAFVEVPLLGQELRLRGQLDVLAPLTRATLRVRGDAVWTTSAVAGGLGVGAVAQFP